MSSNLPQPREAKTFGVGSCLAEEAKVYYSHLSSMDHIGRVSDLFSALLRQYQPNLLKIRMLSLMTGFQAYFVRSAIESGNQAVLMECGHDANFAAIGISFIYPGFGKDALAGLPERIRTQLPANTFEKILFSCADLSDRCYFRIQPQANKIEIVSVFSFSSKELPLNVLISQKLSFILIGETPPPKSVVKEYKELGDTNYEKLLEQKNPNDQIMAPTNGEFIAKSVKVDDFKKIIEDNEKKDNSSKSFSDGAAPTDDSSKTFAGEHARRNNDKFVFKATKEDEEIYESLPEAKETDQELEESSAGLDDVVSAVRGQTLDAVSRNSNNKDETKKAVDSLFKELVGEKSRLVDTARKVNTLLKKKALEFKFKEKTFQEEARRKDEELKQKQSALNHMKEVLSKSSVKIEELNRQVTISSNDAVFKQKYDDTRAELAELKREHILAQRKVSETTKQLVEVKNVVANQSAGASDKQVGELQQKIAQTTRQLEALKQVNQQMMGKVADLEKKRGSGNSQLEEVKTRLAKATQMAQDKSKEAERNRLKIKELQDEKDKLMKELVNLRTAISAAKPNPPKAA